MRRAALAFLTLAGCLLAGALAAAVLAGTSIPGVTGSSSTATTTAPTTTVADVLPAGVTIAGVPVGGLTPAAAIAAVQQAFAAPLPLRIAGHRLAPVPAALGATIQAERAVTQARNAPPGSTIQVVIAVHSERVRAYVAAVGDRFDRPARDAQLFLRNLRPTIAAARAGLVLDRAAAVRAIQGALLANRRAALVLRSKKTPPAVTRADFGYVIVIRRSSNRLSLYFRTRLVHTFGVATGQHRYPTPLGRFTIVVMWRNPWWYPPNSPWAKGQKPIPPGPGNPLGTRWMGLSSPGVGIHGTFEDGSIGYSVSHGCIRMHIPDAEWLFSHVSVGTPVFIVAA
jgi:lipoprotein-anchoring transpeptidase ErfK/SrfK